MDKSINKVELRGRVGQDARILKTENGVMAARFTLATNEIIKGRDESLREETTWHNIVAWSSKNMPNFNTIKKGTFIELVGKIRYIKFKNSAGEERNLTEILALKIIVPLAE